MFTEVVFTDVHLSSLQSVLSLNATVRYKNNNYTLKTGSCLICGNISKFLTENGLLSGKVHYRAKTDHLEAIPFSTNVVISSLILLFFFFSCHPHKVFVAISITSKLMTSEQPLELWKIQLLLLVTHGKLEPAVLMLRTALKILVQTVWIKVAGFSPLDYQC